MYMLLLFTNYINFAGQICQQVESLEMRLNVQQLTINK